MDVAHDMISSNHMKTILSGIKPTGRPHIGNYFGYFRQMINLQNEYKTYAMIADYHALNFIQNGEEMKKLTNDVVIDFLALGFDTEKNILFKQSDVSEHTELAWIFDTITTMPYLARSHAFKAALGNITDSHPSQRFITTKMEQLPEISVGTFNYPMLMAADILLYEPDIVPVGLDQKQHIEYARDTAEKFNRIFGPSNGGDIFKLPEEYIMKEVETVPGIDGRKMSKSYGNTISLFAEDDEIERQVMSIVTDSGGERPQNVFAIHKLIKPENDLQQVYEENKGKYKAIKEILINDLKEFIGPKREKRKEIAENSELIKKVLEEGKEKARAVAGPKLAEAKKAIGVI